MSTSSILAKWKTMRTAACRWHTPCRLWTPLINWLPPCCLRGCQRALLSLSGISQLCGIMSTHHVLFCAAACCTLSWLRPITVGA
jgi:hypothetical protein